MLEAEEDEGPPPPPIGAPSPPPASPPPAESPAVAVSHLIDRATTLIRQNSPFGTPVRGSPLSTPTASLSALHASPSPSPSYPSLPAAAFTPSSPRRPTPGTRSLTVSTPNDVYNIQFSPDLDSLAIDACSLSSLPLQLSACTALRYLRLRENLLEDLPIWLGKLTALQQLDLVGNRLKTLPLEVVLKLTGLTSLALSENAKSVRNAFSFTLPPLITLIRLGDLSLGALNLSAFPAPVLDLPALRTLNLSDNRIAQIPEEISRLTSLHALFINMNPVAALPAGFAKLTALMRLHMHRCIFEHFPQALSTLQALETLHIDHNLLTCLPPSISALTSLSYLSLSNNHISVVPDGLLSLTKLRTLLLDHTEVQSLPAVVRLPELTLVSLRQTPFSYVTIELLPMIDKLVWDSKPVYAESCWPSLQQALTRLHTGSARVSSLRHSAATAMLRAGNAASLPPFMTHDNARACVECRSLFYGEGFTASSLWPYRHLSAQAANSAAASSSAMFPSPASAPALLFYPVLHVACSPVCLAKSVAIAARMIVQFKPQLHTAPPVPQSPEQCVVS